MSHPFLTALRANYAPLFFSTATYGGWRVTAPGTITGQWAEDGGTYEVRCPHQLAERIANLPRDLDDALQFLEAALALNQTIADLSRARAEVAESETSLATAVARMDALADRLALRKDTSSTCQP
jgi:hypothetical protein